MTISRIDRSIHRRGFLAESAGLAVGLAAGATLGSRALAADDAAKVSSDEDGDVYQVMVKLRTPKSGNDKRMPKPLDAVSCSVFLPRGVKTLRGATFNPFYEPTVKQQHWRAAAGLWRFAHVGVNLFGVKKDELGETTLAALKALGEASGHPELAHVPLCFHGMSIGGGLSSRLVEALPPRAIAAAPVCLEVGPRDEASGRVPMITIFGEKDGRQMEKLSEKLPQARANHAQWAIAPQWNRRHEWHMANNIIMPYYKQVIADRLPKNVDPSGGRVKLEDYKESEGWLGDRATWRTPSPEVAAFEDYAGDPEKACWLPDAYTAALWQSFVTHDSPLKIRSPHGVGGGKPFIAYPVGKPVTVKLSVQDDLDAQSIEIFDGDQPLAQVDRDSQTATLNDLQPGIYGLIAVANKSGGARVYSAPKAMVVV